jgi:hypothetical protein
MSDSVYKEAVAPASEPSRELKVILDGVISVT